MFDRDFVAARHIARGGWMHSLREANDESRDLLGNALDDKILAASPLATVETAMLFTYMHRRFGLPNIGGDDYKDLSAAWTITTPRDDLVLLVRPSFAGSGFSFMPAVILPSRETAALKEVVGERLASLAAAYERTLVDLLRPVIQRDMDFNVLGEISDENPAPDWTVCDDDSYDDVPRYHETCGLPMPEGVFGGPHWERLLSTFHTMGGGDYAAGIARFIEDVENRASVALTDAREDIRPLIASGFCLAGLQDAKSRIEQLGLQADDPRIAEFCQAAWGRGLSAEPSAWIMQITSQDVAEAVDLVKAFGFTTTTLANGAEHLERAQHVHLEWTLLKSITHGEIDEALIPDVPYITEAAVELWRRNLADSGDTAVSEWADRLSTDERGRWTLTHILSVLHGHKVTAKWAAEKAAAPAV